MGYPHLTLTENLRLHFAIVAATLPALPGGEGLTRTEAREKAVRYYRMLPRDVKAAVLEEEPIYTAGEILGLSTAEVDDLPAQAWKRFHHLYDEFSGSVLAGERFEDIPDLGPIESSASYELDEIEIEPSPKLG